jgi:hypothetical protein
VDEEKEPVKAHGVFLRAELERSQVTVPRRYLVSVEAPGVSVEYRENGVSDGQAWGGRAEFGYSFEDEHGSSTTPRLGISLSGLGEEAYSRSVLGKDYVFYAQPWWWSMGVGVEWQLPYRFLGFSAEVGWAAVFSDYDSSTADGLDVSAYARTGPAGRVSAVLRLPIPGPAGVGITGSAQGFGVPGSNNIWGTKLSFGVFMEWDGSR